MPYGHQIWWEEPLTKAYCIAGVKGHVGVSWGQEGVNLLSNTLWPPNLVGRTPDQSVMHCWGQRSCRGQPEVKLLRNAVWPPNLVGRTLYQSVTHCWVRGHAGVSQGQPEVKFFRNALWPPNLTERTPDQSVMHRWVKGHITKISKSLCVSGYAFRHASRYGAESWHGGRGRAHEVCGHIFEATPPEVKGHLRVNLP